MKRLAGARWFSARGARCKALGLNLHQAYVVCGMIGAHIPAWASNAFLSGWVIQPGTETAITMDEYAGRPKQYLSDFADGEED